MGNLTYDFIAGTNQIRNLHAAAPRNNRATTAPCPSQPIHTEGGSGCPAAKASESWLGVYYTTAETNGTITAAVTDHFTVTSEPPPPNRGTLPPLPRNHPHLRICKPQPRNPYLPPPFSQLQTSEPRNPAQTSGPPSEPKPRIGTPPPLRGLDPSACRAEPKPSTVFSKESTSQNLNSDPNLPPLPPPALPNLGTSDPRPPQCVKADLGTRKLLNLDEKR